MEIKYFPDTDTLLIDFSDREIIETKDINENILVEFDSNGELVSMTIEHAKNHMDVDSLSFHRVIKQDALEITELQLVEIDRCLQSYRAAPDRRNSWETVEERLQAEQ